MVHAAGGRAITVSDPDGADPPVRVRVSVSLGTLTLPRRDGLTPPASGDAGSTLTFDGTVAHVNAALEHLVYTPAPDASGPVSLVFEVSDPAAPGLSDLSTASILVHPVNDAPVLEPLGRMRVPAGKAVSLRASANDVDGVELRYSLVGAPGGAAIDPVTGAFDWTPVAPGVYALEVVVHDGGTPDLSDRQTVTITVEATPAAAPPASEPQRTPEPLPAPEARDDSGRATTPGELVIDVLANDLVAAADSIRLTAGKPDHGRVRVLKDNRIAYTPAAGYRGNDSFRYTISGVNGRSSANVSIAVAIALDTGSWLTGAALGGGSTSDDQTRKTLVQPSRALNTGFLVIATALLQTVQGLDTPVRLLGPAGIWCLLLLASFAFFRGRGAFLVEGIPRSDTLTVYDRPEGTRLYRLRHDEGPIWSTGRRRKINGRTWIPVTTPAGRGYVQLHQLLHLDNATDAPDTVLE